VFVAAQNRAGNASSKIEGFWNRPSDGG